MESSDVAKGRRLDIKFHPPKLNTEPKTENPTEEPTRKFCAAHEHTPHRCKELNTKSKRKIGPGKVKGEMMDSTRDTLDDTKLFLRKIMFICCKLFLSTEHRHIRSAQIRTNTRLLRGWSHRRSPKGAGRTLNFARQT